MTELDGEFGWVKQDNETTLHTTILPDFWTIAGKNRPQCIATHCIWSKLSQTQVSCVWKSATNIRALKVELPTRLKHT